MAQPMTAIKAERSRRSGGRTSHGLPFAAKDRSIGRSSAFHRNPQSSQSSQFYSDWWQNGAPEEIRTPDPQIRSLVLYPAELRARFSPGIRGLRAGWIRDRPGNVAKERFSYPLRPRLASLMALDIAGRLTANSAGIIGVFRGARPTSPNDENASYFTPAPARYGR
jgi:hypothetical protein